MAITVQRVTSTPNRENVVPVISPALEDLDYGDGISGIARPLIRIPENASVLLPPPRANAGTSARTAAAQQQARPPFDRDSALARLTAIAHTGSRNDAAE